MPLAPPILVTGSHRSGTTWVGRVLAAAPDVGYVSEPFRPDHRPGIMSAPTPHWFAYPTGVEREAVAAAMRRTVTFRYDHVAELRALRSPRDGARMVRDATRFAILRVRRARALVKDPIALFSAPWLADDVDFDVVVTIRHPAAFASSLKRLGWTHDFTHYLAQPGLVDDLVPELRGPIERFAATPPDVIDQASLMWTIAHSVIARYRRERPAWSFVRHEDLSREPESRFRDLAARLALEQGGAMRRTIAETTSPRNPAEARAGVAHQLRRSSAANVDSWRSRLTSDEVMRIREATAPVWREFYAEEEW
jgi:hypothetical protein